MLKRIKIRGKLLLLLVTPILAIMVFAATGILDRLDNRDFQEREARIADLADAGSDLSLAVQVQRTRNVALEFRRYSVRVSLPPQMGRRRPMPAKMSCTRKRAPIPSFFAVSLSSCNG